MERNERGTGRGTFYVIMGVATLVFTLIGATFAYFVAEANTAANAARAEGAEVTLEMADIQTGLKTDLIPIDVALTGTVNGASKQLFNTEGYTLDGVSYKYAGIGTNDCRDANGNNICSVYQFTVTNPTNNTASQRVYAWFNVKTNGFQNLKYAIFKGTASEVASSLLGWDVDGTAITAKMSTFDDIGSTKEYGASDWVSNSQYMPTTYSSFIKTLTAADAERKNAIGNRGDLVITGTTMHASGSNNKLAPLNQILDVGESATYTMLMWIDETDGNQTTADAGKTFEGGFKFTTEDTANSTGVTGSLLVYSS